MSVKSAVAVQDKHLTICCFFSYRVEKVEQGSAGCSFAWLDINKLEKICYDLGDPILLRHPDGLESDFTNLLLKK